MAAGDPAAEDSVAAVAVEALAADTDRPLEGCMVDSITDYGIMADGILGRGIMAVAAWAGFWA